MSSTSSSMWGGRFSEATDQFVAAFTASVQFDQRMYRQDIRGSLAHARMLARQGIIACEQPELHVHPRIQVGIGDLLTKGIIYFVTMTVTFRYLVGTVNRFNN